MGLRSNGVAAHDDQLGRVRPDSPMEDGDTFNTRVGSTAAKPILLDPSPREGATSTTLEPPRKRIKVDCRQMKELKIEEDLPKVLDESEAIDPLENLPPPIPNMVPQNALNEQSGASETPKAQVLECVAKMKTLFRAPGGKMRPADRRKRHIEEALVEFDTLVSVLGPEDQISCIEYLNSQIIHEHNKSDRNKRHQVALVQFPSDAIEALRRSFSLVPTPPEMTFKVAESLVSWPVEFECRPSFIRKLQLMDVARGFQQIGGNWPKISRAEFKEMSDKLCERHNGSLSKGDKDRVDAQIIFEEVQVVDSDDHTENQDEEMVDADDQEASDEEKASRETHKQPIKKQVLEEDKMEVEPLQFAEPVDVGHHDPPAPETIPWQGCQFCNNDGHYRPQCPEPFRQYCDSCNQACSCGMLPNERVVWV